MPHTRRCSPRAFDCDQSQRARSGSRGPCLRLPRLSSTRSAVTSDVMSAGCHSFGFGIVASGTTACLAHLLTSYARQRTALPPSSSTQADPQANEQTDESWQSREIPATELLAQDVIRQYCTNETGNRKALKQT